MPKDAVRKLTFTIQNQGVYDKTGKVKQDFLDWFKGEFPQLVSYIIVQEQNLEDKVKKDFIDTHLQGSLYFNKQIRFNTLLKAFNNKFPCTKTDDGTIGRVWIKGIEGRDDAMDNYFKMASKPGMDQNPLSDLIHKRDLYYNNQVNNMLNDLMLSALRTQYEIAGRKRLSKDTSGLTETHIKNEIDIQLQGVKFFK